MIKTTLAENKNDTAGLVILKHFIVAPNWFITHNYIKA